MFLDLLSHHKLLVVSNTSYWFQEFTIGYVIALAMLINLIVATLSGATIPIYLKKLGIDPAIAGGVILTTVTDVVGFFAFLGLATLVYAN